jgi:hypothetical protein
MNNNDDEVQATVDLYVKATENDGQMVQVTEQPTSTSPADDASAAVKTKQQMDMARSILMNENGVVG